jgi:ATP-dependent Clp protease ATP-binding subunit ClpC
VDDTIVFHQLERDEIFSIVDLMIAKVDERLKDRDMAIELRPDAKDLLSQRGYDPVLGARPLRRTIQREIEDSLSEKILFGELRPGQIVIVDVEGSGETAKFTFNGVPKPEIAGEPVDTKEPVDTNEPVDTHDRAVGSSAGGTGAKDGGGTASAHG